ncbi:MAG: hypothetical protein J07HQW1_00705 [Haloquadratum walsbyi J07HQW1]|uniref:Uncharacterized protein n=1 Tax=Haloquadratum walsbyi J07HQW1 TaxID=1238424 RepID=U1N2T9_9EURY|nr:MAG: hypothetical protein J07HQW1_00705 [Haloquadratum walsbyi J07HQW1]
MAVPAEPSQCHECHDEDIAEISETLQSDSYFMKAENH